MADGLPEAQGRGLKQFAVAAQVVNLSRGGISIECSEKLERGRVYSIRLSWSGKVFDVKGRAVWSLDGGNGRYRSGIKFAEFAEFDDNIIDFITSLQGHMADSQRYYPRKEMDHTRVLLSYP